MYVWRRRWGRGADNLIGVESAKVLAQKVSSKNASDVSPTLDWVTVTEKVALPVGALKRNDLSTLDLGRMKLGAADAIILAAALRTNSSLTVLDLPCERCENAFPHPHPPHKYIGTHICTYVLVCIRT